MPENRPRSAPRLDAARTIQGYRRRRSRIMPVIFSGLALILLVGVAGLLVSWLRGSAPPTFLVTPTLTPTLTLTPLPPTRTPVPSDTAPAATPTELLTPTPTRPFTYTVELGDTLYGIAEKFDLSVTVLMAANGITDPSLNIGQQLVIPPGDAQPPTATPLPPDLRPGTLIPYFVQSGDTIQSIASRFNSTAEAIAKENKLTDVNRIAVGQLLQIPVNLVTPTPTATATATATP